MSNLGRNLLEEREEECKLLHGSLTAARTEVKEEKSSYEALRQKLFADGKEEAASLLEARERYPHLNPQRQPCVQEINRLSP